MEKIHEHEIVEFGGEKAAPSTVQPQRMRKKKGRTKLNVKNKSSIRACDKSAFNFAYTCELYFIWAQSARTAAAMVPCICLIINK